jgi:transposase
MGQRTAEEVPAELSPGMSRLPTKAHLPSWVKLYPGNNKSDGKRMSGRTGHCNRWLRASLVEAAWGAAHIRDTRFSSQYHCIASRRGRKHAIVAVAQTVLVIVYFLLRDGIAYDDLGENYFDERDRQQMYHRETMLTPVWRLRL